MPSWPHLKVPRNRIEIVKINIANFEQARLLVVGDVMLDRYWHGGTSRISPEAPVPVVNVKADEDRPGGAANVALNIVGLGAAATLGGIVGDDENADRLEQQLHQAGINTCFQHSAEVPTITKLRVMSRNQQLIRLDFEESLQALSTAPLQGAFAQALSHHDVVILSDYGKGTLQDVQALIQQAREAGKRVLIDPKGSDFERYRDASLITPNMAEFEAVVGPCASESDIEAKGEALCQSLGLEALLITRSEKGMTLIRQGLPALHVPTRAREVYDVTGAGDTVIATLALALAAGHELPEAITVANLAAGIVVGKQGTATVSIAELYTALHEDRPMESGVVSEATLIEAVRAAHARGERVVMTNGCFDILHAGHVAYLEQARQLGDRLIVAVNDDASVARLKGPQRPINPLLRRQQVLAGLQAVDWVTAFSEDTPARLIEAILPDVLVKGGDYQPEDVAGGQAVMAHGGTVQILDFVDGVSTTAIVNSILDRD